MTALNYVFDGTLENFQQLVMDNSHKGVVLVNYWKPGVGPCFKLWQALEKLSQEYQGRFLLVNVNTDTQTSLIQEHGITSVPTVKFYQQGDIVESIYGAQSEAMLRETLNHYVPPAQDTAIAEAIRTYQSGHVDDALMKLANASAREPDNLKLYSTAIKLMLREKRYPDIETYVSNLPGQVQTQPEIDALRVHAKILHLAQEAPPADQLDQRLEETPDDLDAALSRAAVAMVDDDYETALSQLMHVVEKDRHYCDELPRKAMLVIFSQLGHQHELTRFFQKALREVLH